MEQWLEGFIWETGQLQARILEGPQVRTVAQLGELRTHGIPAHGRKIRKAFTTRFDEWTQTESTRYTAAFGAEGVHAGGTRHDVFSLRCGRSEYLVPALVLLRGLFPLIPLGLSYAFTPRPLEALCIPLTRAGHWTVVMPEFTGVYNARFRRSTLEALTWASLYSSARNTWNSVYRAARAGRMSLDLPRASARVVPYGVRVGNTVYVTKLVVNALVAHEEPAQFAATASKSFVLMKNAEPLAPGANAYYETHDAPDTAGLCLTDDEWELVKAGCLRPKASRGREVRDEPRAVADGLLMRIVTSLPWGDIPVPIAGHALARHWRVWRADGRLAHVLEALSTTRENATSLRLRFEDLNREDEEGVEMPV